MDENYIFIINIAENISDHNEGWKESLSSPRKLMKRLEMNADQANEKSRGCLFRARNVVKVTHTVTCI
jgi:hypothetical protein